MLSDGSVMQRAHACITAEMLRQDDNPRRSKGPLLGLATAGAQYKIMLSGTRVVWFS